jgi:hypothetical protein
MYLLLVLLMAFILCCILSLITEYTQLGAQTLDTDDRRYLDYPVSADAYLAEPVVSKPTAISTAIKQKRLTHNSTVYSSFQFDDDDLQDPKPRSRRRRLHRHLDNTPIRQYTDFAFPRQTYSVVPFPPLYDATPRFGSVGRFPPCYGTAPGLDSPLAYSSKKERLAFKKYKKYDPPLQDFYNIPPPPMWELPQPQWQAPQPLRAITKVMHYWVDGEYYGVSANQA